MWQNPKCDNTQKLKIKKLKNKKYNKTESSNCDKILKLEMWQNSKTQNVETLKNSECEEKKLKNSKFDKIQKIEMLQKNK